MCDLVYDVETIFHLSNLLTAYGNLFCNMSDALEIANSSFTCITHISEKIYRCCLHFRDATNSLHSVL